MQEGRQKRLQRVPLTAVLSRCRDARPRHRRLWCDLRQRALIRPNPQRGPDLPLDPVQVGRVLHIVQVIGLDHQQWRQGIVGKVTFIRLSQALDICPVHIPLVSPVPHSDAPHQQIGIGPQIDHQIRERRPVGQHAVQLPVDVQFIPCQSHLGEQAILLECIICNQRALFQQIGGHLLLAVAAKQEEHLGLKGVPLSIGVKVGKERVLLERLQQQASSQA